jgi:hypothetical protein
VSVTVLTSGSLGAGGRKTATIVAGSAAASNPLQQGTFWCSNGAANYTVSGRGIVSFYSGGGNITIDGAVVTGTQYGGLLNRQFYTSVVIPSGHANGVTVPSGAPITMSQNYSKSQTVWTQSIGPGGPGFDNTYSITLPSGGAIVETATWYPVFQNNGQGNQGINQQYWLMLNGAQTGNVNKTLAYESWGDGSADGWRYGQYFKFPVQAYCTGTIKVRAYAAGGTDNTPHYATLMVAYRGV